MTDLILVTGIIQALSLATFLLLPSNSRLVSNQLLVATLVFFTARLGEIFLFGCNFFEFVSGYRGEAAKRRLADPSDASSIPQVMYDAGFNSKSVLNTAFKNTTALTPSEYRRRNARSANSSSEVSS